MSDRGQRPWAAPAVSCLAWRSWEQRPWTRPCGSASNWEEKSRGAASPLIAVGGSPGRDARCYWRRLGARKLNALQRQPLPPRAAPAPGRPWPCHGRALPGGPLAGEAF